MGIPAPASQVGSSNVGASVASGAAAGSAFGPYGAAIGAVVGLVTPYLNEDFRGGGGGGDDVSGANLFGLDQRNSQHVTTVVSSPVDQLFTPSVNVNLGSVGGISPSNTGGQTSTNSPSVTPDQSITPQSNPLSGLYAQPGGSGLTLPYGPGTTGPGISASLPPTAILLLGGLVLLLVMAGKHHHR